MFQINLANSVARYLRKLEKKQPELNTSIMEFLEKIKNAEDPLHSATKLKDCENRYRWRLGDYRIIGEVTKDKKIKITFINIVEIGHRKEVYNNPKK